MPKPTRALEQLYCSCSQQLFVCALAVTGSPALAEDAVHEAFCRMLTSNSRPRDLKAYVFRAVRNAAINLARRHASVGGSLPDFVFDPKPPPPAQAEDAEFRQQVVALFQELSADERETIVAHLYAELTFQEIATARDIPLGTVTSWYRRGLAKLRLKLEVADGPV